MMSIQKKINTINYEKAILARNICSKHIFFQTTVHSISNFIYVETENGAKSESRGSHSGKSEVEESDQSDLEGQLMALGERW